MGVGRDYKKQLVHYLRKTVNFADDGKAYVKVGVIPAGSLILKPASGIHVTTVFNGGTNIMHVGTPGNTDLFGTSLALGTATFVPLDEAIGGFLCAAETTVVAEVVLTGAAASAGSGEVIIAYIPDNDG